MKTFKKIISGLMAFLMVFALTAVAAPAQEAKAENETLTAYLAYADSSWTYQYWGEAENEKGVKYTNAEITDWGQYTVGLDFTSTADGSAKGLAFTGLMITNGEIARPGAIITVDEVKINGEVVEMGEGYTSSDDQITTRYNLMNEWVSALPEDARNMSGDLSNATWTPLNKDLCAEVKTIEVTFTYSPAVRAYIDYANADWSAQIWTGASDNGIVATMPEITGEGTYTASLDFTGTANGYVDGIAFTALMMGRGDLVYPEHALQLDKVEINGEEVEFGKYYTTSDNGVDTRINLYNTWCGHDATTGILDVSGIEFARRVDGDLTDVSPVPVAAELFNGVETLSVTFTVALAANYGKVERTYVTPSAEFPTTAYLAYADGSWGDAQFWGDAAAAPLVKATTAEVTGFGQYTVGVDFTGTANGKAAGAAAFTAVMVKDLEQIAPGACLTVNKVEINGTEVQIGNAYTSSDDGKETRSNLYNAWVSELPADARTAAGSLEGATPTPMTAEQLTDVQTMYVTFTISPYTTASINYTDGSWGVSYWGADAETMGIKVVEPVVYAPGTYTASIDFTGTAAGAVDGVSFAALMLNRGEVAFPYAILDVKEIKVNGEAVAFKPGYTTYDNDGSYQTRVNLYNTWVGVDATTGMLPNDDTRPTDVRTADGSADVTPQMLDAAILNGVKTIEVTFEFIEGEAPVVEEVEKVVYTADKMGAYNAYIWFQTDNYTFRNTQTDATYGKESNPEIFAQITTWDADNNAQKNPGELVDVEIKGNGTYKVGVTGFSANSSTEGAAPYFRILGFSTDIPADETIVFSDVKIKMDGKTVYTFNEAFMDPDDAKRGLHSVLAINEYNKELKADHEFGYNFPSEMWIEFTVSGFDYDFVAEGTETPAEPTEAPAEPTAAPTEAPAEPTAAPTEAPAEPTAAPTTAPAETPADAEGGLNPIVIVVIVVAVIAIAGAAAFVVMKKKK